MIKEIELISPYVYVGVKKKDLPVDFLEKYIKYKSRYRQEMVLEAIKEVFDITYQELQSKYRFGPIVEARHIYCFLMRKYLKWSFKSIGESINRDHTTVMHSIRTCEDLCFAEPEYKKTLNHLQNIVEWKA